MRACFFARTHDRGVLERVEFYRTDLDILRTLGFEVVVATSWSEIPWDADLYFVWWWTWALLPLLRARLHGRPVVITGTFDLRWPDGGGDYYSRPVWQRTLLRAALRAARANIFVSQLEYAGVTRELGARHAFYVPHAVDCARYVDRGGPRDDLVLTVAWLERSSARRKCVAEIVRAAPIVRAQHPGVRFVVVGERGDAYPELAVLARQLGVEGCLEFAGPVSESRKIELLQRCAVYLQPTRFEGFGLAILEAMSCGAAVVTSSAGAVPEVLGDAGIYADSLSPGDLAAAVVRLLDDAALQRDLGRRARERAVQLFPLERRRRELESIIRTLVEGA